MDNEEDTNEVIQEKNLKKKKKKTKKVDNSGAIDTNNGEESNILDKTNN